MIVSLCLFNRNFHWVIEIVLMYYHFSIQTQKNEKYKNGTFLIDRLVCIYTIEHNENNMC